MCPVRRSLLFVALSAAALWSATPGQASAHCRAGVGSDSNAACVEDPDVPRLNWRRDCNTYTVASAVFERVTALGEAEIRAVLDESFAAWSEVDCGRDAFLVEQADGDTAANTADFEWGVENESVIGALDGDEWRELEYDPRAVAITNLFHDPETGEIFDVDMLLNTTAGEFALCDAVCAVGQIDLRNTVVHEAGHYLGLGHSTVEGATMTPYASPGETDKATLESDDREGYCALELPERDADDGSCGPPPVYSSTPDDDAGSRRGGGCGVARAHGVSCAVALCGLALAWLAVRRYSARS